MSSSVTIDRAVKRRWTESGLDVLFRAYWADPASMAYLVLNDTEARANTPMPYCVYEAMQGFRSSRSTGSTCEPHKSIEYWTFPIQFSIHATQKNGRSAKDIAYELLGRPNTGDVLNDGSGILKAFHDSAGRLEMEGEDRHIQTHIEGDIARREDDTEWVVVLMLNIEIERRQRIRGLGA